MTERSRRPASIQEPSAEGIALIAELIAALTLAVALIGFRIRRSLPWLVGSIIAFVVLLAAVTIIVNSTA
jgi:hypothetical protein